MQETALYFLKFGLLAAMYGFLWLVLRRLAADLPPALAPRSAAEAPSAGDPAEGAEFCLETVGGQDQVDTTGPIPLIESLTFGRASYCSVRLHDPFSSARHARLHLAGGTLRLEDLGSTNGTFVGSERLEGSTELKPGERFSIGDVTFAVKKNS